MPATGRRAWNGAFLRNRTSALWGNTIRCPSASAATPKAGSRSIAPSGLDSRDEHSLRENSTPGGLHYLVRWLRRREWSAPVRATAAGRVGQRARFAPRRFQNSDERRCAACPPPWPIPGQDTAGETLETGIVLLRLESAVMHNPDLKQFVGIESGSSVDRLGENPIDGCQNIVQPCLVIPHRGTASARARSRTLGRNTRSVAKSTRT